MLGLWRRVWSEQTVLRSEWFTNEPSIGQTGKRKRPVVSTTDKKGSCASSYSEEIFTLKESRIFWIMKRKRTQHETLRRFMDPFSEGLRRAEACFKTSICNNIICDHSTNAATYYTMYDQTRFYYNIGISHTKPYLLVSIAEEWPTDWRR